jgi:hypothetical protein
VYRGISTVAMFEGKYKLCTEKIQEVTFGVICSQSLQHKINQSTIACNSLLDRAVELVEEKMCGSLQESGNVRQWLELQIRDRIGYY